MPAESAQDPFQEAAQHVPLGITPEVEYERVDGHGDQPGQEDGSDESALPSQGLHARALQNAVPVVGERPHHQGSDAGLGQGAGERTLEELGRKGLEAHPEHGVLPDGGDAVRDGQPFDAVTRQHGDQ